MEQDQPQYPKNEKRQCVDVWLTNPLVIEAHGGGVHAPKDKNVQKVRIWLTNPLIIEAKAVLPPENTRIVQICNQPELNNPCPNTELGN